MVEAEEDQLRKSYQAEIMKVLKALRRGRSQILVPPRVDLHKMRYKAPFHSTPELFIQTGGGTDFECPGQSFRLEEGNICVMPRGVPHAETPVDLRTPYGILVIGNSGDRLYLMRARSEREVKIFGYGVILLDRNPHLELVHYLDAASEFPELPPEHQEPFLRGLVEVFLLRVHGLLGEDAAAPLSALPPLIQAACKYAHVHLHDPDLSVQSMARNLACTPDHLSRQFHRAQGITLTTWIAQERVEMAQQLLAESRYNISEVGWATGFRSPSYFIRVFKKFTGITPRHYCEQARLSKVTTKTASGLLELPGE